MIAASIDGVAKASVAICMRLLSLHSCYQAHPVLLRLLRAEQILGRRAEPPADDSPRWRVSDVQG